MAGSTNPNGRRRPSGRNAEGGALVAKPNGHHWAREVKAAVLADFIAEGDLPLAAQRHGVPITTARDWCFRDRDVLATARRRFADEVTVRAQPLIGKLFERATHLLDSANTHVPLRDIAITFDKLSQHLPWWINAGEQSVMQPGDLTPEKMAELEDELLRRLQRRRELRGGQEGEVGSVGCSADVIEGEVVEDIERRFGGAPPSQGVAEKSDYTPPKSDPHGPSDV